MSVQTSQKTTTTYHTVKVASPEPLSVAAGDGTLIAATAVGSTSPVQYALNGYETVRYLVPVQQQQQQHSYVLMQQPVMQQVVSPVYLQGLQQLSVSGHDTELLYQQRSAVSCGSLV